MEIFEEEDEEIKQLMLRISRKEITLCETCEALFDYVPQKVFCDECMRAKKRERQQRPEYKAYRREYDHKRNQRPEVKAKARKYYQRPEVKAKARKYYQRKKKLREEE